MPSLVQHARVLAWAGRRPEAAMVVDELCAELPEFMETAG